ncbi:DUF5996 family protein [Sphingomicrobium aestuariivivum]|uniref:DUF5996 family protein n=1 Tax=Sphingomicrobium aestuariivivum TaxID=1582356 RepID=UPI001FD66711|nr:DUF5996 family protein [Sphingomicrobium aestuariivivum]MCJ8191186.1 DUF5996 family protein [Sphingomicrobium aestuariivivum]
MHWPELDAESDGSTWARLHLASQMIGKVKLANSPWTNHGWHIALQPAAEGLATLPIDAGGRRFTLALDLCSHAIALSTDNGARDGVPLGEGTIADMHDALVAMLGRHGLPNDFNGMPNEVEDAVPFASDDRPLPYDENAAMRLRQALVAMLPVFERYRAGFIGKSSPLHFFWGSFDLAVTRFSGREAPRHPGGIPGLPDRITREAYSHEVSSAGFWGGGAAGADPIFYAYAYPSPEGYADASLSVGGWSDELSEWVLPYAEVRGADDPEGMLAAFLEESYALAARLGGWPAGLLRAPVAP